ncbi:hypothetical protein GW943_02835 [Candidatus Parcubacteria bacterium]|uniref:Ig-like domain-containing protein n=1 Tax=Candidatus Kaiserbacteria bacterium CG10_big_fil_rev_8_21_14_0_10_47_16 TaxID=1974608 RepID=A0A2H0UDY4_9BACT|nr:hypothetical protein [Candidatus Parcubacteria bacterium]PIR84612.1 MAG: hypothetical protein COU16_03500 [Candidatus Kaiserbacteria bacterium CG10_big_fil_rev_8_21_14_0_10_47_16]
MKSVSITSTLIAVFFVCVCSFFLVFAGYVHAQSFADEASLEVSPRTPAPFSTVTVSLNAYTLDTVGASIRWYIDGTESTNVRNERAITLIAKDLGEATVVRATLTLASGVPLTVSTTIVPTSIDLIIEADTLVPSFYKGRALPVSGAPLTLIAIPHDGSNKGPGSYSYSWKLGEDILFGGSVMGKYRITTTMPQYSRPLVVTVYDSTGKTVGSAAVNLEPVSPELYFYETNPLRGLSERAVNGSYTLIGDEVTMRAEPYFMTANIFSQSPLIAWTIDGREVATNETDSGSITLRREGGSGSANIGFRLSNQAQFLQHVTGSFNLSFQ